MILLNFISMDNRKLLNRKELKSLRSHLRNSSTSAEAASLDVLKSKKPDGNPHGEYHKIHNDEIRDN